MDKDYSNLSDEYLANELENKILNDFEINGDETIDLDKLVEDAKEMRKILHMRDNNKKRIVDEFEKNILVDIPDGSEETLIRDLEDFNNQMYGSPDSIFFHLSSNRINQIPKEKPQIAEEHFDDANLYDNKMLNPIDSIPATIIEKEYDDEFDVIGNAPLNVNRFDDILDEERITQVLGDKNKLFVVDGVEDKDKILTYIENEIDNGKFNLIKVKRPLYVSGKKIHRKIKSIRRKFIDTYGSEIFSKVSDWIIEEQNLYQNLERIDRINKYKENKMRLAKQMQLKEKLRRFFK